MTRRNVWTLGMWPVVLLLALALAGAIGASRMPGPDSWHELPDAVYQVVLDREVVLTEPPRERPRGVIFAFTGCLQKVTDLGFASPACPTCHGTPELMTLVWKAVRRGYAVVALGPRRGGDQWACYDTHWPPEQFPEIPGMIQVIRHILRTRHWWRMPRYALGSSSGGVAALNLAFRFPLQGVASMLMGLREEAAAGAPPHAANAHTGAAWPYPPTMLMYTPYDEDRILKRINATLAALRGHSVTVAEHALQPYPLSPTFFAERMREVNISLSKQLYSRLQAVGLIQADGYAAYRKCEGCWDHKYEALKDALWEWFPDLEDRRHDHKFKEMLWAAEAQHETTSEHMDVILDFWEAHGATAPQRDEFQLTHAPEPGVSAVERPVLASPAPAHGQA